MIAQARTSDLQGDRRVYHQSLVGGSTAQIALVSLSEESMESAEKKWILSDRRDILTGEESLTFMHWDYR